MELDIEKMLNKKDVRSLGSMLILVHQQWLIEQHWDDFGNYQRWIKNTLKKYTPKRTKFIELTHTPITLKVRFKGMQTDHTFITDGKTIKVYTI